MMPRPEGGLQGLHLIGDLAGVDPAHPWMTMPHALREACLNAVERAGLRAVGECFHGFSPTRPGQLAGVTGVVLLAESHLAVHTWPERGAVTLDVFVCNLEGDNSARAEALFKALVEGFGPSQATCQSLRRGLLDASAT